MQPELDFNRHAALNHRRTLTRTGFAGGFLVHRNDDKVGGGTGHDALVSLLIRRISHEMFGNVGSCY